MIRFKELVKKYNVSRPTIYKWISLGCPVHYVGKIAYFDTEEIDNWIKVGAK